MTAEDVTQRIATIPDGAAVAAPTAAELDDCAREPIRIPGGIQPHGALLVLDPDTFTVLQASDNSRAFLGQAFDARQGLASLPGGAAAMDSLRAWRDSGEPIALRTLEIGGALRQMLAHRVPQGIIVEFEDGPAADSETLEALYPRLRGFLEGLTPAAGLEALCRAAAQQVRSLTRFDRVLIYRFDSDWNGAVIAEDGNGELPSYLDLRFPAGDIPAQARELYRLNRLRLIPTADYQPSPITPALSPVDGRPLDLSLASLRSVSPVHLEYMRNMGTWASMSVSIIVDDRLWGLIACHNARPRAVSAHIRAACDFLGQLLALQIGSALRLAQAAERLHFKTLQTRVVSSLTADGAFDRALIRDAADWMGLTNAAGAAVVTADGVFCVGQAPPAEQIKALVEQLDQRDDRQLSVTDRLAEDLPGLQLDDVAGLVAVAISRIHASYILWFRPEVVTTVTWAGDPRKPRGGGG